MEKELCRPSASSSPCRRLLLCGLFATLGFSASSADLQAADPHAMPPKVVVHQGDHHLAWVDGRHVQLPVAKASVVSSPRIQGDQWWVTATERHAEGTRISLIRGQDDKVVEQSLVREASDMVLFGPQPIVDAEGLQAVLWLEGSEIRRSEVRFASWQNGAISEPKTLSLRGIGTQTALSVTPLSDGSWLAVWTAFDGHDDEILWSRYRQDATGGSGQWSAPAPLAANNQVPDITPRVVATEAGALVAWSRFDGRDYRVMVAHFSDKPLSDKTLSDKTGGGQPTDSSVTTANPWSEPLAVGGRGTVYPEFLPTASPTLAFRQAVPAGWTLLRLDADGNPLAEAHQPTDEKSVPFVQSLDDQKVALQWLSIDADKSQPVAKSAIELPWRSPSP